MLLASTRVTMAVFGVFLTLEVTEILLAYGYLQNSTSVVKWGGYIGVVTAAVAWYTSFAGVANSLSSRPVLPVGGPIWRDRAVDTRPSSQMDHRGAQRAH
jgi:succinate-acetate transporter protein